MIIPRDVVVTTVVSRLIDASHVPDLIAYPGILEPQWDDEYWCDTDPNCHDTSYQGEHPEAFEWTCCEGDAEAAPCEVERHEESPKSKEARMV